MTEEDRLYRLEQAVVYLQELVLRADNSIFKDGATKESMAALGTLVAQISDEHRGRSTGS